MSYYIVGSDLTEVTFVDEGTTVVLEDTGDTLKITTVAAYDSNGIQFQTSGGTNTVLLKDDSTVEIDGDVRFAPSAISTAHITTAGSLQIDADNNMHIGHSGADSVRIGRTNTALAKVHIRSGSDSDLVVSDGKVGIGMDDPSHSLEIDGDIQLSPTAISTAHIDTAGSLKIDAANNMHIGHTGADSVRIGRVNTGLAKVHVRSGADTDLVVSNSKVGIGVEDPDHSLEVLATSDQLKLSYDADSFAALTVDSSSNLFLDPASTGYIKLNADVRVKEDGYIGTDSGSVLLQFDGTLKKLIAGTSANRSTLEVTGGMISYVRAVTAATDTIQANDHIITADTSSNTITFTLPSATVVGQVYQIKDLGNASANNVTINVAGSDTIDGAASLTISTNYANAVLVCTASTKWSIL